MSTAKNKLDINDINNWKRTNKKSYEVYVCMSPVGITIYNNLEKVSYTTTEQRRFIISGTMGEQWLIPLDKLIKTYSFLDGSPITKDELERRTVIINGEPVIEWMHLKTLPGGGSTNYAFHLPINQVQNFPITTKSGDVLYANAPGVGHGKGDFLVCSPDANGYPNINDCWIVNGDVFTRTYDMRAFPGVGSDQALNQPTPEPASLLKKYGYTGNSKRFNTPGRSNLEKAKQLLTTMIADKSLITKLDGDWQRSDLSLRNSNSYSSYYATLYVMEENPDSGDILLCNNDNILEEDYIDFKDNNSIKQGLELMLSWVLTKNTEQSIKNNKAIKDFSEKIASMIVKATNGRLKTNVDYMAEDDCTIHIDPTGEYKGYFVQLYPVTGSIAMFNYSKGNDNPPDPYEYDIELKNKDGFLNTIKYIDNFITKGWLPGRSNIEKAKQDIQKMIGDRNIEVSIDDYGDGSLFLNITSELGLDAYCSSIITNEDDIDDGYILISNTDETVNDQLRISFDNKAEFNKMANMLITWVASKTPEEEVKTKYNINVD